MDAELSGRAFLIRCIAALGVRANCSHPFLPAPDWDSSATQPQPLGRALFVIGCAWYFADSLDGAQAQTGSPA